MTVIATSIDEVSPSRRIQLGIKCWGEISRRILLQEITPERDGVAEVKGITSQGVYLGLPESRIGEQRWQIFLTTNPWHGPLTLNLPIGTDDPNRILVAPVLQSIKPGENATFSAQRIEFSETGLTILTGSAVSWEASGSIQLVQPREQRWSLLREIIRHPTAQNTRNGLLWLTNSLLNRTDETGDSENPISLAFQRLCQAVTQQDTDKILAAIAPFLGLGNGLTPSGDDLICGFLLAINRMEKWLALEIDLAMLNSRVCQMAWEKTSDLSASLIECACQAQADERLIAALDGVAYGGLSPGEVIPLLAGWGNTSGSDALAGMAVALTCLQTTG
jgi:hypothetical protein